MFQFSRKKRLSILVILLSATFASIVHPVIAGTALPTSDQWQLSASHSHRYRPITLAIDGDASTRWNTGAAQAPGQSIDINLTQVSTFTRIVLDTVQSPNDYPRAYEVYTSSDGSNWGSPVVSGNGDSAITSIDFPTTQTAQYIRIVQTGSDGYYYWSIDEMEIINENAGIPFSDQWQLSASHSHRYSPITLAVDGDASTRWNTGAAQAPGQSIDINLTQVSTFTRIVLDTVQNPNDYPRAYEVYTSNDGSNWRSPVVSGNGDSAITSIDFPTTQTAQYIRIVQTGSDGYYYWSIDEIAIQNTSLPIDPTGDPILPVVTGSSQKTWHSWKAEADSFIATDKKYQAALKSHASTDMYFESFDTLFGLYRIWQATGDFDYLDKAFDLVESDIDGAVRLDEFYAANPGPGGGYFRPSLPYKGWPMHGNYWAETQGRIWEDGFNFFSPPLDEFINDIGGKDYSYSYIAARDTSTPLATTPLSENIYARFMADMLRIVYKYPEVLSKVSGNGETYGSRSNSVLSYLEAHIWEKWVEYESVPRHKEYYVYRANTHMSNHLTSVALSLYSITGENKYRDFIDEFLYDFGSDPGSPIVAGIGYMDQLHVDAGGAYIYSSVWGEKPINMGGEGSAQDIGHIGTELLFLAQALEEGIEFDQTDVDRFSKTIINNVIIGDPTISTSVTYRIDDGQVVWWNKSQMTQGIYVMAQYHEDILRFLENNYNNKISDMAHGVYAARIFSGENIPYSGH